MEQPPAAAPSSEGYWATLSGHWSRIYHWWKGRTTAAEGRDLCCCSLVPDQTLARRVCVEEGLSNIYRWQAQLYSFLALQNWRVRTVTHALSAMQHPPSLVVVHCGSAQQNQRENYMNSRQIKELGGYSPEHNTIWICGNRLWSPFNFRRVLLHELLHAFDFARAKIDTNNCKHIACTEIRATNLSEQCGLWASRTLAPADLESPLDRHLLLHHAARESRRLQQEAAAAKVLSDEAAAAALDAARAAAAASAANAAAIEGSTTSNAAAAALAKAERLAARAAASAKAANDADELNSAAASMATPPWESSKRNACVARQARLSVQQLPQCKEPGVAVGADCLVDFQGLALIVYRKACKLLPSRRIMELLQAQVVVGMGLWTCLQCC